MVLSMAGSGDGRRRFVAWSQLIFVAVATFGILLVARGGWAAQSCQDCDECMTNCVCQSDGTCAGTPLPSTTSCDDGNPCTTGDHCNGAGKCVGGVNASSSTPCTYILNPCATNTHCDGAGTCVAGGTKNVNDPCSYYEGPCGSGTCQDLGFGIIACVLPCLGVDQDPCHQCDPNTGQCTYNPCSSDPCSTGCDPSEGCIPGHEGAPCNDFNECTSNDQCHNGECNGTAGGTPVATPTATPKPVLAKCIGDCDGNGFVTVDEIITGINIALGNVDLFTCEDFDANGDSQVTVDEILTAVNNALDGCPLVQPSATPRRPTATPTRTPTSPGGTPTPTTSAGVIPTTVGTASIGARAVGSIENTTSALLVIPNLIAGITRGLSGGGLGGSASLFPPIPFTCDSGSGTVACDQTLFPNTTPPTYTVTFSNCQVSGASGTLTFNGTVTVEDQQAEICFTAIPTAATIRAQNLTIQMPNGTTATFSGFSAGAQLACGSGSCSCVTDTVSLTPTGTITVTGNPSAQISFGNGSSITVSIDTFNAQCVPIKYNMDVEGSVTLTTNGNPPFAAVYSNYGIYDDASSGQDMVEIDGDVTSTCFGDTVSFATITDIALGNPCPSAGVVYVIANTSGTVDTITYSSGSVHIDFGAGGSADFGSCLAAGLFACPGS
jgi:hypothetical protein